MQLKRPNVLLIQRRERPEFSLESLLSGGAGVVNRDEWLALAPHIGVEVVLQLEDLSVLDSLRENGSTTREELEGRFGEPRITPLIEAGLLIGDHPQHADFRARDQMLRDTAWWAPAAVAHSFGRWQGVDVAVDESRNGRRSLDKMLDQHGPPPSENLSVRPEATWRSLPDPRKTALDELLAGRSTCRNFDPAFVLPLAELSAVLHRVFGAQATQVLGPGAVALKKNSPSGGGLHPIEAFLLVQRVQGLESGLYHYHAGAHALEPMRAVPEAAISELAHELVAGQAWFANAPLQILMVARFQRTYWKYRNHAKAWKVIQLDAGHLSQNLYISATEFGYGAFITGAINDECAERCFELDGLATGAIAVCGFGRRSEDMVTMELDPLGKAVR